MLRSTNYSRTEPSTEPITVADLSLARIEHHEHDDELRDLIAETRRLCEDQLGDVCLIDQTCVDYFDEFDDYMELHYSPVDSVTTVKYYDTDGVLQTLSTDTWEDRTRNGMGIVQLKYDQSWPTVRSHEDVVEITYTAGYGTAADVPKLIKRWIKLRVQYLYDGMEWDRQLDALLTPDRTIRAIGC